ncbi:MAG TPA: glycosyltransferase family 39 protein, partial [Gemmatimonadaceae bacterium]|nr:glycosyltransferase family 39 protein [Gemmatimonadaceae bacterium]
PNEPIYGEAVREMAARGEWLVPYVNGMPFGEKPILFYWLARVAGVATFGVNEFSLRLPSALFGIAGTLLAWQLVLPYAGARRARSAGLLFASTYMVFWGSRSVQMDLFVAVTTLGVIVPVTRVWDHGLSPTRGWVLAGVAAGVGFLAKGPVTWICPGLALALYAATTGRLRELFRLHVLLGGAVAVAVAAPWYVALAAGGHADVLHEVLIRQNFTRFRNAWDHAEPFWYYLKYFWIDMAPWAWLVPLAVGLPGRDPDERRLDRLAWCWIAGIVVFFSLSESKRSPYILPIAGGVAALASGVVVSGLEHRLPARRAIALRGIAALLGVLLLAGAFAAIAKLP